MKVVVTPSFISDSSLWFLLRSKCSYITLRMYKQCFNSRKFYLAENFTFSWFPITTNQTEVPFQYNKYQYLFQVCGAYVYHVSYNAGNYYLLFITSKLVVSFICCVTLLYLNRGLIFTEKIIQLMFIFFFTQ